MGRFLLPREHGAYAQLAFPLLSGLLLGGPSAAAVALSLAAVSGFLAYEPVAVLLGVRGARLQAQQHGAARRQLAVLLPALVLLGGFGLAAAAPETRLLVLAPAGACALLLPLVPVRRVKTLVGETLVIAALAGMHLPIAAAGGASGRALWGPAGVWFAAFFMATLAVHAIKARQKRRDRWIAIVTAAGAAAGALVGSAFALAVPGMRLLGVAFALPLLAVLVLHAARVPPQALKRVGWTLVATNLATLALLTFL